MSSSLPTQTATVGVIIGSTVAAAAAVASTLMLLVYALPMLLSCSSWVESRRNWDKCNAMLHWYTQIHQRETDAPIQVLIICWSSWGSTETAHRLMSSVAFTSLSGLLCTATAAPFEDAFRSRQRRPRSMPHQHCKEKLSRSPLPLQQ